MRSRSLIILLFAILAAFMLPSSAYAVGCPAPDKEGREEVIYRGDGTGLPDVYKTLTSCSNVATLDLDMSLTGCVINGEPWHFRFREGDRLPNLTKLSLSRYDLAGKDTGYIMPEWSWTYWGQKKTIGALRYTKLLPSVVKAWDETNLEKWQRAMDFSHLEELHVAQNDNIFYDRMANELPNLKRLFLHWSAGEYTNAEENRVAFVRNLPPLEEISITIGSPSEYGEPKWQKMFNSREEHRMDFPLQNILDRHCPSLKSLALKQRESEIATKRRPMLSLENITAIHQACPNLASLELDIDRKASTGWPLETFRALIDIESLMNLTIRLELGADMHAGDMNGELDWNPEGISQGGPFRKPVMNATAAEALFARFRGQKQGERLQSVTFEVGDHSEKPYWGPIAFGGWESGRARKFVCETAAGEERAGDLKYGYCHIIGDVDPFGWAGEPARLGSMAAEMWSKSDDAAVDGYLERLKSSDGE